MLATLKEIISLLPLATTQSIDPLGDSAALTGEQADAKLAITDPEMTFPARLEGLTALAISMTKIPPLGRGACGLDCVQVELTSAELLVPERVD